MTTRRGTGRTSNQIRCAPHGAVFICMPSMVPYVHRLAELLKRRDLVIHTPEWLTMERWLGLELTGLVVDHAVTMTADGWESYQNAKTRVR